MLFDQLHITIDRNECMRTNLVQNGYFYILLYSATTKSANTAGYDEMPVIYCVAPDTTNVNNFWGINFHYFKKNIQELIFERMVKDYNITAEDDVRVILNGKQLNYIYSSIHLGLRCYSRKNVLDCYRIKNSFLPKYLELGDKFKITNNLGRDNRFETAPGNKGF